MSLPIEDHRACSTWSLKSLVDPTRSHQEIDVAQERVFVASD
jgi:hypothetical protein